MAFKTALEAYKADNKALPTGPNSAIVAALQGKGSKRVYFEFRSAILDGAGNVIDPWGRPYVFLPHNGKLGIISYGANGVMDSAPTSDDISAYTR